jgi:galactofuranose transport system permease protein
MKRKSLINSRNLATFVTIGLFIVMFGIGSVSFTGFFTLQNFFNLFIDNSFILIISVGMTFVIIAGGIDLSVGSMLAFSTMLTSGLLEHAHMSVALVIPLVLLTGTALGLFMGYLIQAFDLPPFIITLAGLYLGRGLCYVVSINTIPVTNTAFLDIANFRINLIGDNSISSGAVISIVVVLAALYVLRRTKFGRTVLAIGGNEQSAILMGLPVASTKIAIYALSGFCAALAGIVFTFYTMSGYALNGKGMELDAIASVVIGGTLLTGGVGTIVGTVFGVFVYGIIQVLIMFQGTLNSWWTRIVIGFLVFLFCFLQRVFEAGKDVQITKAKQVEAAPPRRAPTA